MLYSSPKQLCFPPVAGHTLRADFDGGALSSDFGPLLLRGVDRQIGLTERLATAIHDKRHLSYIDHPLRDLLAQRIYQIASGYADGNDANSLRHDPVFKLGVGHLPLAPDQDLASAPTFSRLEHSIDRKDLYRLTKAFVDQLIAGYSEPPAAIVLDLDHSDDPTHGQQEFAFYNHYYQSYCYMPLFVFEGTSHALVMAYLRPGARRLVKIFELAFPLEVTPLSSPALRLVFRPTITHTQRAATPKFEVKRPGVSGHSNEFMDVPFSGYFASNFVGTARVTMDGKG